MVFSRSQQMAIALIPKFSASFSLLGSGCIINEILCSRTGRRKLRRVYHRILLVMSIYDVIESSFNFMSSWPIPEDTPNVAFNVGAPGWNPWCEAQGFVLQFGLAIPILNMCLSIYYLLVIRFSWSEERIRKWAEPWFHVLALGCALSTASLGIRYELFNNSNLWCWYAPLPLDCKDSFRYGAEANCIRGDNAWIYRWGAYYAPLWFCILAVMFIMGFVYACVRRLEAANTKYLRESLNSNILAGAAQEAAAATAGADGSESSNSRVRVGRRMVMKRESKSRRVAAQALWYVGAFYATFLFATINRLVQQITGKTFFPLICFHAIMEPGQGFLNYLVYLRPRFLKYRDQHPDATFWDIVRMIYSRDPNKVVISAYVDEDHEDEAEARHELAVWRRKLLRSSRRLRSSLRFESSRMSIGDGDHSTSGAVLRIARRNDRDRSRSSTVDDDVVDGSKWEEMNAQEDADLCANERLDEEDKDTSRALDDEDVEAVHFGRRRKEVGFSLNEDDECGNTAQHTTAAADLATEDERSTKKEDLQQSQEIARSYTEQTVQEDESYKDESHEVVT